MAIRRALTYEDYAAMPSEGYRCEILDGELSVTATPATLHQRIVGSLYWALRRHVEDRRLGEVFLSPITVILAPTTIVEPDIVFVDTGRAGLVSSRGIEGAPTLAVEVLSPSTTARDLGPKFQLYARYGVPWYWIIDSDARAVDAYELADDRYRLAMRAQRDTAASLAPLPDLALVPDSLWPSS